jgi:hypothetical protein
MRFLDIHGVAGNRIFSANIHSVTFIKAHLKCAIRIDSPNCPQRVRPSSYNGGLPALLKHCAPGNQCDANNCQNERDLLFHNAMLFVR